MTDNALIESNRSLKEQFAEALLRNPSDAFGAAKSLGVDINTALMITQNWVMCPEVAEMQRSMLLERGLAEFLPDKDEAALMILEKAREAKKISEFKELMELYGKFRGFIQKPGTTINNNTAILNPVMEVPMAGSLQDWADVASRQQQHLLEVATSEEENIVEGSVNAPAESTK